MKDDDDDDDEFASGGIKNGQLTMINVSKLRRLDQRSDSRGLAAPKMLNVVNAHTHTMMDVNE